MTLADFIVTIGYPRFLTLCVLAVLFAAAAVYIVLKALNELSLKVGNVAISLKGEQHKKDIVDLVFDFGEFQDSINDTRDLAVEVLHKQAKRFTKSQLMQYIRRLRGEYAKRLEGCKDDDNGVQITGVIFNLFCNEIKDSMFGYMMDIYEKNHLAGKSDQELKTLAHDHYEKLADLFRDYAASIWLPIMRPYSQVREISLGISAFAEGLVYDMLIFYKGRSIARGEILDAARKICAGAKRLVSDKLKLPTNAQYLAEHFFTEDGGLDTKLVEEFLNT